MNIDWTTREGHVPESLKQRVERHLGKLERYLRGHAEASVIVSQDGNPNGIVRKGVEIIVRHRLGTFTAREESHDLGESATAVLSRVEAQVQKAHDKMLATRRRSGGDVWTEESVGSD